MAILKCGLVTLIAGLNTIQATLNGLDYNLLSTTQKWNLAFAVVIAMSNNIISFLDRTISRIVTEQKDLQNPPDSITLPKPTEIKQP